MNYKIFTVYDLINNDIEGKYMHFGWKVEVPDKNTITLKYLMLNFDWNSLKFLGEEAWNMFLNSKSYQAMKERKDIALNRFGRTYFEAVSIEHLKMMIDEVGLKIDIDKLISKEIKRKSESITKKLKEKDNDC